MTFEMEPPQEPCPDCEAGSEKIYADPGDFLTFEFDRPTPLPVPPSVPPFVFEYCDALARLTDTLTGADPESNALLRRSREIYAPDCAAPNAPEPPRE